MPKRRWWGTELERLRVDYESRKISLIELARKHRTSLGMIARLSRKHGWKARRGWVNPLQPTIGMLKERKNFLLRRREADLRELENVEHKINRLIAFGDP